MASAVARWRKLRKLGRRIAQQAITESPTVSQRRIQRPPECCKRYKPGLCWECTSERMLTTELGRAILKAWRAKRKRKPPPGPAVKQGVRLSRRVKHAARTATKAG